MTRDGQAESGEVCICPYTDPSTWLSAASCGYGSGYELGSMQEWNPDCPVHVPTPCACPDPLRAVNPRCELHGHSPVAPAPTQVERQCADAGQVEAVPGHRYGLMDGRGGQWLVESCDEFPEPSPIGLVDDILAAQVAAIADGGLAGKVRALAKQWERLATSGGQYAEIRRRHADELRALLASGDGNCYRHDLHEHDDECRGGGCGTCSCDLLTKLGAAIRADGDTFSERQVDLICEWLAGWVE